MVSAAARLLASALFLFALIPKSQSKVIQLDFGIHSELFDRGRNTAAFGIRMGDILQFVCEPNVEYEIHMFSAIRALSCQVYREHTEHLVGYCKPSSTANPRVAIRPVNAVPNAPVFAENHKYYFVAVGNKSRRGNELDYCEQNGMRVRVDVGQRRKNRTFFATREELIYEQMRYERERGYLIGYPIQSPMDPEKRHFVVGRRQIGDIQRSASAHRFEYNISSGSPTLTVAWLWPLLWVLAASRLL